MSDQSMPTVLVVDAQRSCAEIVKITLQDIKCEVVYESRKHRQNIFCDAKSGCGVPEK
jgi:hypothetical protein